MLLAQITYEQLLEKLKSDLATNVAHQAASTNKVAAVFANPSWEHWPYYLAIIIAVIIALALLSGFFFTIEQQSVGLVERFGKFVRTAGAGIHFKWPLIESVEEVSLQVQELCSARNVTNAEGEVTGTKRSIPNVSTKTKDDVTVTLGVQVQYRVVPSKVFEAHYLLDDAEDQMFSFLYDAARAKVPKMTLDEVYAEKDEVANTVRVQMEAALAPNGYEIVNVLVTSVDPDEKVEAAMNEINAAKRLRVAAEEKGEADKILRVKEAEGEAASKMLQGKGIAAQRKAIVDGLKESVAEFKEGVPDSTTQDVMSLVLMTQYFDTLKELGENAKSNTIMIPHSPGAVQDVAAQIRNAMVLTNTAKGES